MFLTKPVYHELLDLAANNYTKETFAILFSQINSSVICKMIAIENKFESPFFVGISKSDFKKGINDNNDYRFSGIFHSHIDYNMKPGISEADIKLMKRYKDLVFIIANVNRYREVKLISYQCPIDKNPPISKTIEL